MKTWTTPVAVGQLFAANEYVSACTRQIVCDFPLPDGTDSFQIQRGCTVDFDGSGSYEDDWQDFAVPCGATHDVSTDTEIFYYTFTHASTPDNYTVELSSPVEIAYWRELGADGTCKDVHWTSPENVANAGANMS